MGGNIFLIIFGIGLILEAIVMFSTGFKGALARAGLGAAGGAAYGYTHSNTKDEKLGNAVTGGMFGGIIMFFAPVIGILLGPALLIGGIRGIIIGPTDCGRESMKPKILALFGDWEGYTCKTKKNAGNTWGACLRRIDYSDETGRGCEGEELCCPPISFIPQDALKALPKKNASDCGSISGSPPKGLVSGIWSRYNCQDEKQAGPTWKKCLSRSQYSKIKGRGCPTGMKCCPPY